MVTEKHKKAYTYLFAPDHMDEDGKAQESVEIKTWRPFSTGWIGFPRGNLQKIEDVFGKDLRIIDQRALVPHGYDLEFTGELDSDQLRVWREWLDYQYGMIQAPPRWGKTIFMCWMLCKLKQRTLVLAQEVSLLQQFEEEMRRFTNVDQLEKKHHIKLIGQPRNAEHVQPIATFATWQTYDHHLKQLRENRDSWGAVFVDEAHSCAAPCFARIVNTTNSYYRVAVTATPERKDGAHVVAFDVSGPVVACGIKEQLPVHVKIVKTSVSFTPTGLRGRRFWINYINRIQSHKNRNALIARRAIKDARNGHFVLIVTDRILHIYHLMAKIRELDAEHCGRDPARRRLRVKPLHGLLDNKTVKKLDSHKYRAEFHKRKDLRLEAKARKINIVVAYSKIVQLGWNVPPWSSLHSVLPMSNEPNWYQRISRIRTKCENCPGVDHPDCMKKGLCTKKPPVCHIYVDSSSIAEGCLKTMQEVHKKLGFTEQVEYEDISVNIQRDPERPGRTMTWSEIKD